MVGNFVAESGVGSEAVTKAEHNISFGPKEYSFAGNSTAENVLTNYTENYEYTGSVSMMRELKLLNIQEKSIKRQQRRLQIKPSI